MYKMRTKILLFLIIYMFITVKMCDVLKKDKYCSIGSEKTCVLKIFL